MNNNAIRAEVMQTAQISLELTFAVHVKAPIEMPPRLYNISVQEILVRATSQEHQKRIIYELLSKKVLTDYNRLIEDSPIMDMFADPIKYERCSYIEWIFVDPYGKLIHNMI
jgi:hypothetical protein